MPDSNIPAANMAKRATCELDFLEAMLEGSREGLWLTSTAGDILNMNTAAEQMSHISKNAIVGQKLEQVSEKLSFDWNVAREIISTKRPLAFIQTTVDDTKHLVSGRPILAPGGEVRYVVFSVRDISEMNRMLIRLRETAEHAEGYRRELNTRELCDLKSNRIITQSEAMQAIWNLALKYAAVSSPTLLLGETGSGKRVFAKLIHEASARKAEPFIEVNCGAMPEALIEAELFGYAKGAFTGADRRGKPGLVELAQGGSLLLDEIGDLPFGLQVKLLRFLEDGEIWPLGSVKAKRPDVRIIAATNRDLATMVGEGSFRQDLFYRLNVLTIHIPPLREHPEDIPPLLEMTLSAVSNKYGCRRTFTAAALAALSKYRFPGNVRELSNLVERLAITVDSDSIDVVHLPPEITATSALENTWREAIREVETRMIREALERCKTQKLAAKHLGVSQTTIARKARQYDLS